MSEFLISDKTERPWAVRMWSATEPKKMKAENSHKPELSLGGALSTLSESSFAAKNYIHALIGPQRICLSAMRALLISLNFSKGGLRGFSN